MLLSDFFDHLSYGDLAQYKLGTDDAGYISEADYPKIVSFINRGLSRLHTRLPLKHGQILMQTTLNQKTYKLVSTFAASTAPDVADGVNRFILDHESPFKDDIITVEKVQSQSGFEFPMNDASEDLTVLTPSYNTLQFSQPKDEIVAVMYRAQHPLLPNGPDIDPAAISLDIPDFCIDALGYFCVHRLLSSGANAEAIQESNAFLQKFMMEVEEIKSLGLLNPDINSSQRIWRDGWV